MALLTPEQYSEAHRLDIRYCAHVAFCDGVAGVGSACHRLICKCLIPVCFCYRFNFSFILFCSLDYHKVDFSKPRELPREFSDGTSAEPYAFLV